MANFAECTLIKLVPSEPYYVALTTFDIFYGRFCRFLIRQKDLASLADDENASPVLDTDIGSYIEITRCPKTVYFKLTLLSHDFRNEVTGCVHYFELPISKIYDLLGGQPIHHVEYNRDEKAKAQLTITESSHHLICKFCQDKLTKHALRRFFRDNFNFGHNEWVMIFPDNWVKDFYFKCDRLNGALFVMKELSQVKMERSTKRFSMLCIRKDINL